MKNFSLVLSFCTLANFLSAQSPYVLRNSVEHILLDRMDVLGLSDTFVISSVNNFDAKRGTEMLLRPWENNKLSPKEQYNMAHYFQQYQEFLPVLKKEAEVISDHVFRSYQEEESPVSMHRGYFNKKPFLKYFYKTPAYLFQLQKPGIQLFVNPIIHVAYTNETNNGNIIFQNTRGAEVKGYIDEKVYFFAQVLENQQSFPSFIEASIQKNRAIPGNGFAKAYNSGIINNLSGYDYFFARSYIGFRPVRSIQIELGHGNHFIGHGMRSLLLSDFSVPYFYLKLNTTIWKFHYQNIFQELSAISTLVPRSGDVLIPKKYASTHYLAFRPNHRFEFGLFETVIFARENHFEFQYLNPVILYRAVEHALGSPDNVLLGLNAKYNFLKHFSIYGQVLADEFKINEVFNKSGWWANKFGGQVGIKYFNAFNIDQLDIQCEFNAVRPYTYSHFDSITGYPAYALTSYTTFNQPLAHPLGANFKEFIGIIRYKPLNKLYTQFRWLHSFYGQDKDGLNYGQNILSPNTDRAKDYGNTIGQGIATRLNQVSLDISYELYYNLFADFKYTFRNHNAEAQQNYHLATIGIRWNVGDARVDY